MLFQLSRQTHPNAIQSNIIPREYTSIILPGHTAHVTIDDCCILIQQSIKENGYSLSVNIFTVYKPLKLYSFPTVKIFSLYYCLENTAKLVIMGKRVIIQPGSFCIIELEPLNHYGIFEKGIYKSLHVTVDEDNIGIFRDNEFVAALLRDHYCDIAL